MNDRVWFLSETSPNYRTSPAPDGQWVKVVEHSSYIELEDSLNMEILRLRGILGAIKGLQSLKDKDFKEKVLKLIITA